ncbi:DUF305 domain-containing protein [Nonomuraea sp. CA-141351]|uniref:DUF305 domain-containing protein n=1 Tax=Nonomuraea sp. CA-141351 TaxID=3239996 RepID=UPI003D947C56
MITKPRAVALVTGTLVLSACGSVTAGQDTTAVSNAAPVMTTSSAQPSADFNEADVMFAQMMLQHHRQAVEMADLAGTRASDKEVKDLAAKIKAAQEPEIQTMQSWLKAWGKPMPTGGTMEPGMPGGMSERDMERLKASTGSAFDKEFLRMMIRHHKGAIAMARAEQARGTNPQAKQLAGTIVTDQQAEVEQMRKILDRLQ